MVAQESEFQERWIVSKVTTYAKGNNLFESVMGDHKILVDSPGSWGGENRGPMPPQLFMASLGSCVAVLVNHFCTRHGLDGDGLAVDVEYDKAEHPSRFVNIRVVVKLPSARCPDEVTRKALEHVAEHCPVHETIATLDKVTFVIETSTGKHQMGANL